jgi:hypothetical protein
MSVKIPWILSDDAVAIIAQLYDLKRMLAQEQKILCQTVDDVDRYCNGIIRISQLCSFLEAWYHEKVLDQLGVEVKFKDYLHSHR